MACGFVSFSSSFRWRREGGGAAVGGAQQQEREDRGERRRVLGVLSLSRSTERRKLRAREENGARLEERRRKDRRQKKRKREKKTSPSPLALRHSARHNSIFFSTFLPSLPRPFTPRRRYAKTAGGVHATCSPLRGCRAGRPRSKVADSGGKGGGELPFEDWLLWIQESKLLLSCFSSSSAARRHRPATAAGLPARVPALHGGLRAGPSLDPASV